MPTRKHPIVDVVHEIGDVPALTIPQLRRVCGMNNYERFTPIRVDPLVYYLLRVSLHESVDTDAADGPNGGVVLFGLEYLPY